MGVNQKSLWLEHRKISENQEKREILLLENLAKRLVKTAYCEVKVLVRVLVNYSLWNGHRAVVICSYDL